MFYLSFQVLFYYGIETVQTIYKKESLIVFNLLLTHKTILFCTQRCKNVYDGAGFFIFIKYFLPRCITDYKVITYCYLANRYIIYDMFSMHISQKCSPPAAKGRYDYTL